MTTERELLSRHLRELLEAVENSEIDLSQLRPWLRYWALNAPLSEEISARLNRIEERLSSVGYRHCALAEGKNANSYMHLITGVEGRHREERKSITSWLSGTGTLTIVDPYFFLFAKENKIFRTQEKYVEWLLDLFPKGLERLDVFHLPSPNRRIVASITQHCKMKRISLGKWETTEIHDRVLIKDGIEAKAIGTSFGGFGNKIAFVLDLPKEDLDVFRKELHRIKSQT